MNLNPFFRRLPIVAVVAVFAVAVCEITGRTPHRISASQKPRVVARATTLATEPRSQHVAPIAKAALGKEELEELQRSIVWDRQARALYIDRYVHADASERARIRAVLSGAAASPDVHEFAAALLNSDDPAQRRDGYALLGADRVNRSESIAVAATAMARERDPQLILAALGALENRSEDRGTLDASGVQQLQILIAHDDPAVRAAALRVLATVATRAATEQILDQALSDTDPDVRLAAIDASIAASIQSEEAKAAAIALTGDSTTPSTIRSEALTRLESFALSAAEREAVAENEAALER